MKKLSPLLLFSTLVMTASLLEAATIPAGTTLNVRTLDAILASAGRGHKQKAEIAHDVKVGGKIVLHAGTPCTVVVQTSFGDIKRSSALTLDLISISVNGRTVEVKTTGGFELGAGHRTRHNISVYRAHYTYPRGTPLTFTLARPAIL